MINLKEFRQKYPQYDDMSDQELADSFHKKYYSDIPKEEFYSKIGYKTQVDQPVYEKTPDKGWEGLFTSLFQKAKEAPGEFIEGTKELIPEGVDALAQILTNPQRGATNAAIGINKGFRGAWNTIPNMAAGLESKGLGGDFAKWLANKKIPNGLSDFEQKALNFAPENWGGGKRGDETIQGATSILPSVAVPGGPLVKALMMGQWAVGQDQNPFTGMLMSLFPEAIKKTPSTVKSITESLSKIPDYTENLIDKGLDFIGKENLEEMGQNIAEKQGKKSKIQEWKEKYLAPEPNSVLSPDQLNYNLEAAGNKYVPIGRVFEDPVLATQFENELSATRGSPGRKMMQETAHQITNEGKAILRDLESDSTPQQKVHVGETVINEVRDLGDEIEQIKKKKYGEVDKLAEENGVSTNRANFRKFAKERLADIENDKDLAAQVDPEVKRSLREASTESENENFSIKKTNILKGEFGTLARDAKAANNTKLANVYESMNKALKSDIDTAIEKSGNADLKDLYVDAEQYFKNEWLPFADADIKKYTQGKGDPDMLLQSFLKISKLSDRSKLLKKITDKLDPKTRNLFAHQYLANAFDAYGNLDAMKMRTLWHALGEGQKQALFGNKVALIDKYIKNVGMNTEALTQMFNPKTGFRGVPALTHIASGGAGGILGYLGLPHELTIPATLLAPALTESFARKQTAHMTKKHMSPAYRKKKVREYIEKYHNTPVKIPRDLQLMNEELKRLKEEELSEYNR